MSEYDHEPVRGLPEELPEGEHIIWQGAPDWKSLAASAWHIRLGGLYFAVMAVLALMRGDIASAATMVIFGVTVVALFAWYAWGVGRTTIYTLTNKRIVLRIGVALNKCINLPLAEIEEANLKTLSGDTGSIALSLKGMPRLGYWMLWPHARSLRIVRPQPMLRAIADAAGVAKLLFEATQKVQDIAPADAATAQPASEPVLEGLAA